MLETKVTNQTDEEMTEVSIEEIIDLIRKGESTEILYQDRPYPHPNVITLICGDKYSNDVREVKPIITSHSSTQIYIRSHDKDDVITSWREFYVHSARIYVSFKIDHTIGKVNVEKKVNEATNYPRI